jgi:glycosyltransferase involved in cell wall biosynthesis
VNHIAYLIPTIDRIGGAERQVMQLATGFAKRDWRTSLIALSGTGGDAIETLKSHGVSFDSLAMRKGLADPRGWIRLHQWIKNESPDVLHAHLPHAVLLARWSRTAIKIPVIVDTIHTPATGGVLRRLGYRVSRNLPDLVTAVSRAAAEPWLAAGLVKDTKFIQIPNCVDLDIWKRDDHVRAAIRSELRIADEFLWIAAGRLEPVKDHATLLRAMALLSPSSRLIIAGAGPLERYLRALSDALGLGARVRFLGFEPNLVRWMQAADGLVLSSRWEGLPMVLLEANACELPAVVTDLPGAREVLLNPDYPFIAPVGDATRLAAAMTSLMNTGETERHEMGCRLRQSVAERFGLGIVLQRWENVYCQLIKKNRSSTVPAAQVRIGGSAR